MKLKTLASIVWNMLLTLAIIPYLCYVVVACFAGERRRKVKRFPEHKEKIKGIKFTYGRGYWWPKDGER